MHEMSIAQSVLEIIEESIGNPPRKSLRSVTVAVGELTAVVPDSLQFCFEALIAETPYQGTELIIRHMPLNGYCRDCHYKFSIKNYNFSCPACQSGSIEVTGGQELNVTELEVDD